jgi:hypothetical protein
MKRIVSNASIVNNRSETMSVISYTLHALDRRRVVMRAGMQWEAFRARAINTAPLELRIRRPVSAHAGGATHQLPAVSYPARHLAPSTADSVLLQSCCSSKRAPRPGSATVAAPASTTSSLQPPTATAAPARMKGKIAAVPHGSRALSAPLRSVSGGKAVPWLRVNDRGCSEAANGKSAPLSPQISGGDDEHAEASFFGGVCSGPATQPTCAPPQHYSRISLHFIWMMRWDDLVVK